MPIQTTSQINQPNQHSHPNPPTHTTHVPLINHLRETADLTKDQADTVYHALTEYFQSLTSDTSYLTAANPSINEGTTANQKVVLRGFGTFYTRVVKPRVSNLPGASDELTTDPYVTLGFKPSKALRTVIQEGY